MFKRMFDILISILVFICFFPVMLILAFMVKKKLGSPIIFRQKRPGKNGDIFELYKFRSMTDLIDKEGKLLDDTERLTPFGTKLRSTSLDELPSLFNVLKGDMSLVGPRPLLVEYLPFYNEEQSKRHNVRPGITGWAQVNGRNALSWEKRFEMDVWYVKQQSFILDLKILLMTVKKVFIKEGINFAGDKTTSLFTGTKK